jgi:beta-N-acetylhexosaminidase
MVMAAMPGSATADPPSLWQAVAARGEVAAKTKRKRAQTRSPAKAATAGETAAGKVLSRKELLAADPEALERIGRHIIIGYHSIADVKALVERKAIAGIFVSNRNVRRRKAEDIRAETEALQEIRRSQGLPPLIISADQEGGSVSRLTPPLKRQSSLARVIRKLPPEGDMKAAVEEYARLQAAELNRVGVNLNFSPVVDLMIDSKRRSDGQTQLRHRALSSDPNIVRDVSGWYCDTLATAGVYCTIKHFPGLGRVSLDTHRSAGEIRSAIVELDGADWIPFRDLMSRPHVVTMLGHVRLAEIDKAVPASLSEPVVTGLLRTNWQYEGLLITDDFSMGAVMEWPQGVGGAAVKALNAGVDLVLVSFSEKHLNAVMTALLEADAKGEIDAKKRAASIKRLSAYPFPSVPAIELPVPKSASTATDADATP